MEITVERLSDEELRKKGVFGWLVWEKEVSEFPWHYDSVEECYFLEGDVIVQFGDNHEVHITKGDFVTFPEGLDCRWIITVPVKKHYSFH